MQFIVLLFFVITAHAQIRPADQQYIPQENLLLNPGLEQGRVNWTISGTATVSLEQTASAVLAGLSSLKIVASSQTFEVAQFTTKSAASLNGMQAMASVRVKSNQSGVQVCSIENSVHVKCVSVDSTNQVKEYIIPFVFNSINNGIVIKGTSGTGTTYIDDAYVGIMPANRMPEISQAQLVGEAYIAGTTNCQWSRTSTTLGAFGVDIDCPAPTIVKQNVGVWQTTDTDLPRFTINSLPAGQYKATFQVSTATSVQANASMAIYDGATTCQDVGVEVSTAISMQTISCTFNYESSGNRSFEVYASSGANSVLLNNRVGTGYKEQTKFILEYYPPTSKVYSGATIYPHAQLLGNVNYATSANCVWSVSGTTITNFAADADCANPTATGQVQAPATKIPAIVLPAGSPKGTYKIEAKGFIYAVGATNAQCSYRFSDGTNSSALQSVGTGGGISGLAPNIIGEISYSGDIISNTTIQIQSREDDGNASACNIYADNNQRALEISVYYFPPQDNPIIGTFEGIEKCEDDFECTDVFSAKVSSAGVVSGENLDWINGNCVVSATSLYTCTYNSGIITQSMNCSAIVETVGATARTAMVETNSSSSVGIRVREGGTALAQAFHLICQKNGSDYKPKTAKAATTNEMMYVPNVTRPTFYTWYVGGSTPLLRCTSTPCVVHNGDATKLTVTRASTGVYTATTGSIFKASSFIDCKVQAIDVQVLRANMPTSRLSSVSGVWSEQFTIRDGSATVVDSNFILTCIGDSP